jgi:hypothetical protein
MKLHLRLPGVEAGYRGPSHSCMVSVLWSRQGTVNDTVSSGQRTEAIREPPLEEASKPVLGSISI